MVKGLMFDHVSAQSLVQFCMFRRIARRCGLRISALGSPLVAIRVSLSKRESLGHERVSLKG
jgi:hypothetical protein